MNMSTTGSIATRRISDRRCTSNTTSIPVFFVNRAAVVARATARISSTTTTIEVPTAAIEESVVLDSDSGSVSLSDLVVTVASPGATEAGDCALPGRVVVSGGSGDVQALTRRAVATTKAAERDIVADCMRAPSLPHSTEHTFDTPARVIS